MKAYLLEARNDLAALKLVEVPEPTIGPGEVLVKMRAHAMNYRELLILRGGYFLNKKLPVIPTSDGAGEVVAIGAGVTEFQVGDRVASTFFRDWVSGPPTRDHGNGGGEPSMAPWLNMSLFPNGDW
jgi:NADPH:quinone reductase-like Zn-dependent oxidoreductase